MFRTYLEQVAAGERLSSQAMEGAMEAILKGEVTDIHIAAFLMGLRLRGEDHRRNYRRCPGATAERPQGGGGPKAPSRRGGHRRRRRRNLQHLHRPPLW